MPWIHRDDAVALLIWAATNPEVSGTLNATAPNPVTNREFSKTLGQVLRRPAVAPAPKLALRLARGGELTEAILSSLRVVPRRALDLGYEFRFTELEPALRDLLRALRPISPGGGAAHVVHRDGPERRIALAGLEEGVDDRGAIERVVGAIDRVEDERHRLGAQVPGAAAEVRQGPEGALAAGLRLRRDVVGSLEGRDQRGGAGGRRDLEQAGVIGDRERAERRGRVELADVGDRGRVLDGLAGVRRRPRAGLALPASRTVPGPQRPPASSPACASAARAPVRDLARPRARPAR